VIIVVIFFMFRSFILPLWTVLSIALTLAWTFASAYLLFDYVWFNLPEKHRNHMTGYAWASVPTCIFLITGIGVDYDLFLLTRIIEFSRQGISHHESIRLACAKTGGVITAAGAVMGLGFGCLMFGSVTAIMACGFLVSLSVVFDTFVVRTIVVPVMMAVLSDMNKWPAAGVPPQLAEDKSTDRFADTPEKGTVNHSHRPN
jgi:RND superfamily putative drug exporter